MTVNLPTAPLYNTKTCYFRIFRWRQFSAPGTWLSGRVAMTSVCVLESLPRFRPGTVVTKLHSPSTSVPKSSPWSFLKGFPQIIITNCTVALMIAPAKVYPPSPSTQLSCYMISCILAKFWRYHRTGSYPLKKLSSVCYIFVKWSWERYTWVNNSWEKETVGKYWITEEEIIIIEEDMKIDCLWKWKGRGVKGTHGEIKEETWKLVHSRHSEIVHLYCDIYLYFTYLSVVLTRRFPFIL